MRLTADEIDVMCAIDVIGNAFKDGRLNKIEYNLLRRTILSSRPKGEWRFSPETLCGGYYICSECGKVEREDTDYCPNCGADMREVADDEVN